MALYDWKIWALWILTEDRVWLGSLLVILVLLAIYMIVKGSTYE